MLLGMMHREHSITSVVVLPKLRNLNLFMGEMEQTQNEARKNQVMKEFEETQLLSEICNLGPERRVCVGGGQGGPLLLVFTIKNIIEIISEI